MSHVAFFWMMPDTTAMLCPCKAHPCLDSISCFISCRKTLHKIGKRNVLNNGPSQVVRCMSENSSATMIVEPGTFLMLGQGSSGPFLGNNLFPLKVGLWWVLSMGWNGSKVGQKWVFGCKSGSKCFKTHFCTHFKPISAYSRKPTFTQFKGGRNWFPKRVLRQSRPSIKLFKVLTHTNQKSCLVVLRHASRDRDRQRQRHMQRLKSQRGKDPRSHLMTFKVTILSGTNFCAGAFAPP